MRRIVPIALLLAGALVVGAGCQNGKEDTAAAVATASDGGGQPNSLWNRLGGEKNVRAVVQRFIRRGAKNPQVNFERAGRTNRWQPTPENVARLEQRLVEFISEASGGPLVYKGRSMEVAHKDMWITSTEFDAFAEDLAATLDEFKVPSKEKHELLNAIADTKPQIIER
jgi:hemoglobin